VSQKREVGDGPWRTPLVMLQSWSPFGMAVGLMLNQTNTRDSLKRGWDRLGNV